MLALENFLVDIQSEVKNLATNLRDLFESNLQEQGVIGPHIITLQKNKARRVRELEESFEEVVIRLLSNPVSQGKGCVDGFLDAMQNEVDLLIQAVEKEVALNPKSIGGELLPTPVGAETVVTNTQSRPTFKITGQ